MIHYYQGQYQCDRFKYTRPNNKKTSSVRSLKKNVINSSFLIICQRIKTMIKEIKQKLNQQNNINIFFVDLSLRHSIFSKDKHESIKMFTMLILLILKKQKIYYHIQMSEYPLYIRKPTGICVKMFIPMYESLNDLKLHLQKALLLLNDDFHLQVHGKSIPEHLKSPISQYINTNMIIDVVLNSAPYQAVTHNDLQVQCVMGEQAESLVVGRELTVGEFKEPTCRMFDVDEEEVEFMFGGQVFMNSMTLEQVLEKLEMEPPLMVKIKPLFRPLFPTNTPTLMGLNQLAHSIISESEKSSKNLEKSAESDNFESFGSLRVEKKHSVNYDLQKQQSKSGVLPLDREGKRSMFVGKAPEKQPFKMSSLKMSEIRSTVSYVSMQEQEFPDKIIINLSNPSHSHTYTLECEHQTTIQQVRNKLLTLEPHHHPIFQNYPPTTTLLELEEACTYERHQNIAIMDVMFYYG